MCCRVWEGLGERRRAGRADAEARSGAAIDVAGSGNRSGDDRSKKGIERDEDGAEQVRSRRCQRGDDHDGDADDGEDPARRGHVSTSIMTHDGR